MANRTDPSTISLPHVVIGGNPVDGVLIYGPFLGPVSAVEWADDNMAGQTWWIAPLHPGERKS